MKSGLTSNHFIDNDGNPSGGTTFGSGFAIGWQHGPMVMDEGSRLQQNGAFVEDIIGAAIDRIEYYQRTKFKCGQNDVALLNLGKALEALEARTAIRKSRGVEGTHEV